MARAKCGIRVSVSDWLAEPLIPDQHHFSDKLIMRIPGPQRETPFCSKGGRLVLVITWEGERVTGAIFPTGARRRRGISRWACWSEFWRPDELCLGLAECCAIMGEEEGKRRTGWETCPLPGGSLLTEALGLGQRLFTRDLMYAGDWLPGLPALLQSPGASPCGGRVSLLRRKLPRSLATERR